ncbi:TPA: PIN domain-containing protein [Candidatus Woesearchaeota archaeon]|nr:PIN domain-containing protein [Candidatus Woesearchaeota archaeon]
MRELISRLEHVPWNSVTGLVLLDTCFVISELSRHKELAGFAMTSFNADELEHVSHRLHDREKEAVRHFLKQTDLRILDVPMHPGNWDAEHEFVLRTAPELLRLIPDPSDAILLAVALRTRSTVLTKDRHDLFTAALENYVEKHGVRVLKELKDCR